MGVDELRSYAKRITAAAQSLVPGDPEDQLKRPVSDLLRDAGERLQRDVETMTESRVGEVGGRPDIGVGVEGLLTGHVELKAPGKGARPERFTGADRKQWEKFKALPNLIYTDGAEWTLHRTGILQGAVNLGDLEDLTAAKAGTHVEALFVLLADFLGWQPVVPASMEGLAKLLAPLCRLLRDEVLDAMANKKSALRRLAGDWRQVLFPEASDSQFADAYAQTLTYALLLARLDPATKESGMLTASRASDALEAGHELLAQALRILTDRAARDEIGTAVALLERTITAVAPTKIGGDANTDVWLYFYEQFLGEYDPALREARGVYYTPVEVVRAQVRLVDNLLRHQLGKENSFADANVTVLDPAVGTGTYPLGVVDQALSFASEKYGSGVLPARASQLAQNLHAFEILVGPYTVSHLRLTQRLRDAGAALPHDGVKIYLTDTLEAPQGEMGQLPLFLQRLGDEHERARLVKLGTRIVVCLGNPPYQRQAADVRRTGEKPADRSRRLLGEFLDLARGRTMFSHLASLYNDYVYFWRWALWKVFDSEPGPGIVSFISASSYLGGPGFIGMREVMRRTVDELWIIDLEGSGLGTRRSDNVFAITTPVAIAVAVRYGDGNRDTPADVHYTRIRGTREEKLGALDRIEDFTSLEWETARTGWSEPFLPAATGKFADWPLIVNLFPWQAPGIMVGRTWPIGTSEDVVKKRWARFVSAPVADRARLLPEGRFGRSVSQVPSVGTWPAPASAAALSGIDKDSAIPNVVPYGYRSLVRHWLLADPRLIDLQRPPLWFAHSDKQIYLVSLLTGVLGRGPAASVSAHIPDKHYFRGSFGGKDVIPLWRDRDATDANVTDGVLGRLAQEFATSISAEALFAYCYAVLGNPGYVARFEDAVGTSGPRIPISRDPRLFIRGAELGGELARLHTRGARFTSTDWEPAPGRARAKDPIPLTSQDYPQDFRYDEQTETLLVGKGSFAPVSAAVWQFGYSGMSPIRTWLGYRLREPAGRHSSELDSVVPTAWPGDFTDELLALLWTIERTVEMAVVLDKWLGRVLANQLFSAGDFPEPTMDERAGPAVPRPRRPGRVTSSPRARKV